MREREIDVLQPLPLEKESAEASDEYQNNTAFRDIYQMHRSIILAPHKQGEFINSYNFPLDNNFGMTVIELQLKVLDSHLDHAFKFNLAFGLSLVNIQTGSVSCGTTKIIHKSLHRYNQT